MSIVKPFEDGEVMMQVSITDLTGEMFEEYAHNFRPDDTTLECWIPSVEGKKFEIRWLVSAPKSFSNLDVQATPYLDGKRMDCGILSADEWAQGMEGWLDGYQVGTRKTCPFQFATLEVTDNQSEAECMHLEDLHTIRVELEWGRSGPHTRRKTRRRFIKPKTKGPIHENTVKKGNYSCARLGSPIPSDALSYVMRPFRPVETGMDRVTFIFRYGSADWLRANGIMPLANQPRTTDANEKEIIDVDAIESEPELERLEIERENSAEAELQVEAMITVDSDADNSDEIKSELDASLGQAGEVTAVTHSNMKKGPGGPKSIAKTDKIKSEYDNQVIFNQLKDGEFEDEDVFIYKIMVPAFNLKQPSEDIKVKVEPSDL
ncbi:hypothetical protein RSOLAG22IIIB_00427 [Rhizoctonia solani]|uniref:DUF7918 domain-containing protein n=1 Tax=Rhizoctonia solani TaxID=456999 RepID=A0A0K6FV68_9AGAM|nr:hypothetical protein RSOLAG22IIIB_00427 [Rhizoctonia solani]